MKKVIIMALLPVLIWGTIMTQKVISQSKHDFDLSVDHISQTILPGEKAVYYIEVIPKKDFKVPPISLTLEASGELSPSFKPPKLTKSGIVRLSIKGGNIRGEYKEYKIRVKAKTELNRSNFVHYLDLLLIIANRPTFPLTEANRLTFPPTEPLPLYDIVTLTVSPDSLLTNGLIQPIEGRLIPYKTTIDSINLKLEHPDTTLRIPLSVDTISGHFSYNYVFNKFGRWKATLEDPKNRVFGGIKNRSFTVTKRQPKIAITTKDTRLKSVGDTLEIFGEVVSDTIVSDVQIHMVSSGKDTTLIAIPDNRTKKFCVSYSIADSGIHKLSAHILSNSSAQEQILMQPHGNGEDNNNNSDGDNDAEVEFQVGRTTKDYAIFFMGGEGNSFPDRSQQQQIVNIFYSTLLENRGFIKDDIFLLSDVHFDADNDGTINNDVDAFTKDYKSAIPNNFISKISNKGESQLFIYLIGQVVQQSGTRLVINGLGNAELFTDISDSFKSWFKDFSTVIYFLDCDRSGEFLHELKIGDKKVISISSTTPMKNFDPAYWSPIEGTFSGTFINCVFGNDDISDAFYNSRSYFSKSYKPMLDDNKDGVFYSLGDSTVSQDSLDGIISKGVKIGLNTGNETVQPELTDVQLEASPVGPLLSDYARIIVALDNPNDRFHIMSPTAKIFHSDTLVTKDSLSYDTTNTYKSNRLHFSDFGLYQIMINYSYLDGKRQRYRTYLFEKTRYDTSSKAICATYFDPRLEVGYNYAWEKDIGSGQHQVMIGMNLFSTRKNLLEYLGFGITTDFHRFSCLFMPISLNIGPWISCGRISNLWVYWGVGCELNRKKLRYIGNNLEQFVGLKLNIIDLFRR